MLSHSVMSDFATPQTAAHQVPLSMEFSKQEYWSGLPFPSSGDLPNPGMEPRSPTLQADSLLSGPLSSVQLNHVWLFVTPWTVACQASLSITISQSLLKLTFIELVMPSNHLILCGPLPLLPSIFPSIRLFSNELALHLRWPKYWSFSFSMVFPMNIQDLFSLGWTGWISLQPKEQSRVFSNTTAQKHQLFAVEPSLYSNSLIHNDCCKNHCSDYMDLCQQSEVSDF